MLVENGVAPMQGIHEALEAISSSVCYFGRREAIRQNGIEKLRIKPLSGISTAGIVSTLIDEWEGKKHLLEIGLSVPEGGIADFAEVPEVAEKIGFPVVVKMVGKNLEHKTDAGAIALNLLSCEEVKVAVDSMKKDVEYFDPTGSRRYFLLKRCLRSPLLNCWLMLELILSSEWP
jgi:acyl-CoA synthetase (NDP forming)